MPAKLNSEDEKSIKIEIRKTMKGRPLYFGLMAPSSKKGKFKVSKKKSEVKPPDIKKKFNPYQDEADNKLQGTACMGVCEGNSKTGVLTLSVAGKPPGGAIRFLEYFFSRLLKYKRVQKVEIVQATEDTLPAVPDEHDADKPIETSSLEQRAEQLRSLVEEWEGGGKVSMLRTLTSGREALHTGNLEAADELFDELEILLNRPPDTESSTAPVAPMDHRPLEASLRQARDGISLLEGDIRRSLDEMIRRAVILLKEGIDATGSAATGDAAADVATRNEKLGQVEDLLLEVADRTDGAYQDFYLDWLKELNPKLVELPDSLNEAIGTVKSQIRGRDWAAAKDSYVDIEKRINVFYSNESPSSNRDVSQSELQAMADRQQKLTQVLGVLTMRGDAGETAGKVRQLLDGVQRIIDKGGITPELYAQAMKAHTAVSKLLSEAARVAKNKETDTDAERKWVASAVEATRKIRALQVKCSSIQSDSELERIREAAAIVKKLLDGPVTVLQSSPPPTKAAVDKYDAFFTNSEALKNAATAAPMVGLDCAIIAPLKTALAEYRTSLTT